MTLNFISYNKAEILFNYYFFISRQDNNDEDCVPTNVKSFIFIKFFHNPIFA
jgi:hypothetical protein